MPDATAPDIGKLKIDRGLAPIRTSRRRKWLWLGSVAVAVIAGGAWYAAQPHPVEVATTAVVTSYPSQQFVQLNATGYVVAQRKAAIASKATGRLEWLGVAEGSTVKPARSSPVSTIAMSSRKRRVRRPRFAPRALLWRARKRKSATRARS